MCSARVETDRPSVDQGLAARCLGMITAPRTTLQAVTSHPRWLGMLITVLAILAGTMFVFLSTEVGREALLDGEVRQVEALMGRISDQQYERMEATLPYARYFALVTVAVVPAVMLIVAGLLYGFFNTGVGRNATFRQVFSVVVHSSAVYATAQLFVMPLDYARETLSSPANLGAFFPMLDEAGFLARLLGAVDLFLVWSVIVFAIGVSVLFKRPTRPVAVSLLGLYVAVALLVATVISLRGGV